MRGGIQLIRGSCEALPLLAGRADLVIADPPWKYSQRIGASAAADVYEGLPTPEIRRHLELFLGGRLLLWLTWPLMPEWKHPAGWDWVTGGAWHKHDEDNGGHYGQGFHWAGCTEPLFLYVGRWERGKPYNARTKLRNGWHEPPGAHSAKPIEWQAAMIRRWVPPGGLVVDLYAGEGSVACATLLAGEGRRYVGAELDPERHAKAVAAIVSFAA